MAKWGDPWTQKRRGSDGCIFFSFLITQFPQLLVD